EVMSVDYLNLRSAQIKHKPPQLSDHVSVIETGEGILIDMAETCLLHLLPERALRVQASDTHTVVPALVQQASELHSLALRSAFLEACNQMEYSALQFKSPEASLGAALRFVPAAPTGRPMLESKPT